MEFLETHTMYSKDAKAVWKNDIDVSEKEEAIEESEDESEDEEDSEKNTGEENEKIFCFLYILFYEYVLLSNIDFYVHFEYYHQIIFFYLVFHL